LKGVWPGEQPEPVDAVPRLSAGWDWARARPWLLLPVASLAAFGLAFAMTTSPGPKPSSITTATTPAPTAARHHRARPKLEAVAPVKTPAALAQAGPAITAAAAPVLHAGGVAVTVAPTPVVNQGGTGSGPGSGAGGAGTGSGSGSSPGSGSGRSAPVVKPRAPGTGTVGAGSLASPGSGFFTGGG
jgi:protein TonB